MYFKLLLVCCLVYYMPLTDSLRLCSSFIDYYNPFSPNCWITDQDHLNGTQIIESWGFVSEEHYVITPDGYILLVNRGYMNDSKPKIPFILGHGVVMNGLAFVMRNNESLAFQLGQAGYDVWVINFRGTTYSKSHLNYSFNELQYWEWSFDKVALYDLRSVVHYVTDLTQQKAMYLGYSMGTTVGYIYSSVYPEEANERLYFIMNFASLTYMTLTRSMARIFIPFQDVITAFFTVATHGEFFPGITQIIKTVCSYLPANMFACELVKGLIAGINFAQMSPTITPLVDAMFFDSISIYTLQHYGQVVNSMKFSAYDYGTPERNMLEYGTPEPPQYNTTKIIVPVIVFQGECDWIATPPDTVRFYSTLTNESRAGFNLIDYYRFTHFDYIQARDILEFVYDDVVAIADEWRNNITRNGGVGKIGTTTQSSSYRMTESNIGETGGNSNGQTPDYTGTNYNNIE